MYNKFLNQSYLMQTFIFLSFCLLRFYCRFTVALEDTVWLYYVSKNLIKLILLLKYWQGSGAKTPTELLTFK